MIGLAWMIVYGLAPDQTEVRWLEFRVRRAQQIRLE